MLFSSGQKAKSIQMADSLTKLYPDNATAWAFSANFTTYNLQFKTAIAKWKRALALNPKIFEEYPDFKRIYEETVMAVKVSQ